MRRSEKVSGMAEFRDTAGFFRAIVYFGVRLGYNKYILKFSLNLKNRKDGIYEFS